MSKASLADLRRHARKFDASVEINSNTKNLFDVELIAPKGYHWSEDPHSLVGSTTDTRYKHEVIEDLISRATGLVPCHPEFDNCIDWGCFDVVRKWHVVYIDGGPLVADAVDEFYLDRAEAEARVDELIELGYSSAHIMG